MTKVTYTGNADHRIITGSDFPNREDDFVYEWTPGSWVDVDDETAEFLVEHQRHEFVLYDDPKHRDHRTEEEIRAQASELKIKGRSTMSLEELRDAVDTRLAEKSGEPSGESSIES